MNKFAAVSWMVLLCSVSACAATWIGVISDSHCGPHHTALQGDDKQCIVFISNDDEVYKIANQDAVLEHVGHQVSVTGTLDQEVTIGVTYETQGILHVDSVRMLSPVAASAQEQAEYQSWMKSLGAPTGAVRKAITANDKAAVSAGADKLAAIFEQVASFWQKQNNDDALKFAEAGRDGAKATAAASTTFEQRMAFQKVQGACSGCHLAHRAGKAGQFKIEQ